jgi:hypothetical protein
MAVNENVKLGRYRSGTPERVAETGAPVRARTCARKKDKVGHDARDAFPK